MRLEQKLLYEPRTEEKQREYLVVGNLYGLSAVVLYSSDILRGGSGPIGRLGGDLTIRPLGPNLSLHIHEGAGGTAHIKTNRNEYFNLNSYEAAMIDLLMDEAKIPKIRTTDKCERRGRV